MTSWASFDMKTTDSNSRKWSVDFFKQWGPGTANLTFWFPFFFFPLKFLLKNPSLIHSENKSLHYKRNISSFFKKWEDNKYLVYKKKRKNILKNLIPSSYSLERTGKKIRKLLVTCK